MLKTIIIVILMLSSINLVKSENENEYESTLLQTNRINLEASESNKQFWDKIYTNSLLNTKTKYNSLSGENVCFTCPIDQTTFDSLYQEAKRTQQQQESSKSPPKITIAWSSQLSNDRVIFFCRNNTRMTSSPIYLSSDQMDSDLIHTDGGSSSSDSSQLEYSCDNNRLCLTNLKHNYPENYQCMVKSYVLNVKLNVIVQLQYVSLYFAGESVKFDYQKEVQVFENQIFTVKCEVPETNPVSNVNAYIDGRELKLSRLEKKTIDNRMTINTYSFEINATRNMNGKQVKCEAKMKDLPAELATSIDLRSHISKAYTILVYYVPTCVYNERIYRTGLNRSIIIECPINSSNPDVTYYKMIPPTTRTRIDQIETDLDTLRQMGRFRINPVSQGDFGLYECIPRSSAGTAKCDITVELGSTPNPPEQCMVQFAVVNNKTYAQFSCKPGFNQGGVTSFLTIYEINPIDKQLKLSGRVNIDEGKSDKEVPYITPADEDKYYEFLIMQENNYGNSTSIMLTLGVSEETKEVEFWHSKNVFMIGIGVGILIFILFLCLCCCFADSLTCFKTSDNACLKCLAGSDRLNEHDTSTYKKAPLDGSDGSTLINQPFQGFNQEINSKNFGPITSTTYEYYDNATSGGNDHYSHYKLQQQQQQQQQREKYNQYDDDDDDELEEDEDHDVDEEHYMNEGRIVAKRAHSVAAHHNHYSNNNKHLEAMNAYEDDDVDDDSSEMSSGRKSSQADDQQVFITATNLNLNRKGFDDNFTRTKLSSKVGSAAYNLNPNNYSTIDSKNLKLIKTENGLVYTPLNSNLTLKKNNKSNDALEIKEDFNIITTDERQQRNNNTSKPIISSTYSNVKKITPSTNGLLTTNNTNSSNNQINSNFQNELSLKLKSITSNKEQQQQQNNSSPNTTPTTINTNNTVNNKIYQSEPLSNSTATTSLSSASSCTSNSDLTLKKDINNFPNTNTKRLAPLATNNDTNSDIDNTNQSYSLLKTTLNINGTTNNKPPILKPKPRGTANNYQLNGVVVNKKILNTTFDSVHNQSTDPLLLNQTSPTTSVTDVSSTNCTPSHQEHAVGATVDDHITAVQLNNLVKNNNNYRTATLSRPKATTTFTNNTINGDPNQAIYSTTKINATNNDHIVLTTYTNGNGNSLLKTFGSNNNNNYETTTTLNRKTKNLLDPIPKFPDSRTLERRHVKNSEC